MSLWLLASPAVLAAVPGGGLSVRADQGALTAVESWWSPDPGVEGRWWWDGATGGSAWVRVGGLQAGPLETKPGTEGLRAWNRAGARTSGRWGLGLDLGAGGLWAVQGPGEFEAGLQGRAGTGGWTLAAGADRTWDLGLAEAGAAPWTDRCRAGAGWSGTLDPGGGPALEAGWAGEGTAVLPAGGPGGWEARGRLTASGEPWSFGVRAAAAGTSGPQTWEAGAQGGWGPWNLGWSGRQDRPGGRIEGSWSDGSPEVRVAWGPRTGTEVRGRLPVRWDGVTAAFRAGAEWKEGLLTGEAGAEASGPWDPGRWSAGWTVGPGSPEPVQTVTAGWKDRRFAAEARWRVEGRRLGWLGAGSEFRLTLKFLF